MIEKIKTFFKNISINEILDFFKISNSIDIKKSLILTWVIMIFTVLTVFWASFSNINQVVVGNGEVTPESQVHQIQSPLTGPIEKINISMGDKVKKNEVLFLISNAQHLQSYETSLSEVKEREKKVKILEDLLIKVLNQKLG